MLGLHETMQNEFAEKRPFSEKEKKLQTTICHIKWLKELVHVTNLDVERFITLSCIDIAYLYKTVSTNFIIHFTE